MLEVAYIGSATRKIGINRPVNSLTPDEIALGDTFLNALVPNPFVGLVPDGGARNTSATIQRRELMRPLPQFAGDTTSVWCRSARWTIRRSSCRGTSG